MIHIAVALFVVSLTVAALTIISFVSPDIEDADTVLWTGAPEERAEHGYSCR